ncbi:hypothetical protein SAMN05660297_03565 [Natronincola peptidivorans]|uniref:Uncharacterized protein n=1 Tax=Natronincola peptidivorans TaxID=426128 RepID=A0A1I0HA54_9FIRM|nr:hypothetical protein [Natronincola peptidivorans]SET80539.1 hypothetical protein SAMN05660297_03565 [Natronincola peptidivorans]
MARIIHLRDYKVSKQRKLIVNIYQLLNRGLEDELDTILMEFDESFITVCKKYNLDAMNVDYFRLPIITFIVTSFIKNSEIRDYFPQSLVLENEDNKHMFKNTLIKILETFDDSYQYNDIRHKAEEELEAIIDEGLCRLLQIIPQKIYLV